MSRIQTIFKNMSWLLVSQIITSICAFIWTILVARYLGVEKYGILGFAISFTTIIGMVDDLGISTHIVRHIATDYESAPKYLGNAIPVKLIFSIAKMALSILILLILGTNELTIAITLLLSIEIIFKSYINLFNGTFQSFEIGKYQGIGNIILNVGTLIFILLSIHSNWGIYGVAFSYVIANLIATAYEYCILRKHIVKPKYELDIKFCKRIIKLSVPFVLIGILYTIYYSIDVIMLTNMVGDYATGIYNATYKLISVLTLFYGIYAAVIFPVMVKFYKENEKLFLISYEKSIKYLMLVIIPIAIATMLYSTDIIQLIYGHQYDASSSVLSILIWTACLLFISGAGNTLLNASYKEVAVTKIYVIAAAFNVVLNFILIPSLSYNGAAITTVLSDILIVIIQIYVIYKIGHRPNKKLYSDLVKIIIGSAILGIALYSLNLNMWVALPVGIIIYFVTVYLIGVFDDDDKYIVKEILGKN